MDVGCARVEQLPELVGDRRLVAHDRQIGDRFAAASLDHTFEVRLRAVHRGGLTADLTNVTGYYSTHFPLVQPPFVREAPAYFERDGSHYLVTSGTTGYYPNPSMVAVAPTYHGPWRVLNDPHPDDATRTSYQSQASSA